MTSRSEGKKNERKSERLQRRSNAACRWSAGSCRTNRALVEWLQQIGLRALTKVFEYGCRASGQPQGNHDARGGWRGP